MIDGLDSEEGPGEGWSDFESDGENESDFESNDESEEMMAVDGEKEEEDESEEEEEEDEWEVVDDGVEVEAEASEDEWEVVSHEEEGEDRWEEIDRDSDSGGGEMVEDVEFEVDEDGVEVASVQDILAMQARMRAARLDKRPLTDEDQESDDEEEGEESEEESEEDENEDEVESEEAPMLIPAGPVSSSDAPSASGSEAVAKRRIEMTRILTDEDWENIRRLRAKRDDETGAAKKRRLSEYDDCSRNE